MNIYHVGTYLIPLESWEGAEQCPFDKTGIGYLVVEESGVESKSTRKVSSLNIYRPGRHLTPLCSWEGAEQYPIDGTGIGYLVVEQSDVVSKSTSIDTSLITEANSMDIHRVRTYPIPLESWEGAEHPPCD